MNSVFKSEEGKQAILKVYDGLLEKWPVPCEALALGTSYGAAFAIACGDRSLPPLFLLHGSSSNSAMWIGDAAEYAQHFRVYALDLPGEPGRSAEVRPDLGSGVFEDWLNQVLEALNVNKAFFVGVSLGGWLALKFAAAHPEKVEKLALLCPSGIGPQRASVIFRMLPLMLLGPWGEKRALRLVMGDVELSEETVEYSRLISKNFTPFLGTVPVLSDDELRRLTMPVLLVAGEKDVLLNSRKTALRAEKLIPNAKIVLLPEAGHGLIDQRQRILPFLTETSTPASI